MNDRNRPEIGTAMYSVHEHLYYIPGRAAPVMEYCVCKATVKGFFPGGYTEVRLVGPNPEGYQTPYSYKLSEIGKKLFYSPHEAAILARQMTETYDRIWGWTDETPLRRPWAHLLEQTKIGTIGGGCYAKQHMPRMRR